MITMRIKKSFPKESFLEKNVSSKSVHKLILTFCALAAFMAITGAGASAQYKIIHTFGLTSPANGYAPFPGVISNGAGQLYGSTAAGGNHGAGTVFELTPSGTGSWTLKVLYNFNSGDTPNAFLVMDGTGNFYGTTVRGGASGCGTVFELLPGPLGNLTRRLLRSFNCFPDAQFPAGVVLDASGNVFGTSSFGGTYNLGVVFELKHAAGANWPEKIVYSFGSYDIDGQRPEGSLLFDASGNIYGTTNVGGNGFGTVYEITKAGAEQILYAFDDGFDGAYPLFGLTFDPAGNLYGTTNSGGSSLNGVVFEMTRSGSAWTEFPLYTFPGNINEGALPQGPVVLDSAGNVYGETLRGTGSTDFGSVFKLSPTTGGGYWTETQLVTFRTDILGSSPQGGLIFGSDGNLYGTTQSGGPGSGVVFQVAP
jgi:uncharacterized repeat protein (TIGR03803 family)